MPTISTLNGTTFPHLIQMALKKGNIPVVKRSHPNLGTDTFQLTNGKNLSVSLPVTLTPYASAKACSARCQFCSENLREDSRAPLTSSQLRPTDSYFSHLQNALDTLINVPFGISLSGLEATDDEEWFLELLNVLRQHERNNNVKFPEKILYSNGSGFSEQSSRPKILASLRSFGIHRIEFSRHSHMQEENDRIMRFRPNHKAASNQAFIEAVSIVAKEFNTKLVCIPQHGGIDTLEKLEAYLEWSFEAGIKDVVVREFSLLANSYTQNRTEKYISRNRVDIVSLMDNSGLLNNAKKEWQIKTSTLGYYFWNITYVWKGKMQVTFESADYSIMNKLHNSNNVYKLIFHANGNLTADWSPFKRLILAPNQEEILTPVKVLEMHR